MSPARRLAVLFALAELRGAFRPRFFRRRPMSARALVIDAELLRLLTERTT